MEKNKKEGETEKDICEICGEKIKDKGKFDKSICNDCEDLEWARILGW